MSDAPYVPLVERVRELAAFNGPIADFVPPSRRRAFAGRTL